MSQLTTYQHWLWYGAMRQQAITWTSIEQGPRRHMASLSHNLINEGSVGPNELWFTDDILKHMFLNDFFKFQLNCHWNVFLQDWLMIIENWSRQGLGERLVCSCWRIGMSLWSTIGVNSLRPSDTHALVNKAIIGSDNGLSPVRRQAIIWNNVGIMLIGTLGKNSVRFESKYKTFI